MNERDKMIEALKNAIVIDGVLKMSTEVRDIIVELLKGQEAVKPKKVKGYNPPMYTIYEYECENCKSPILNKQPFCMGCGRRLEWDEQGRDPEKDLHHHP